MMSPCPLHYGTSLFATPAVEGVWGKAWATHRSSCHLPFKQREVIQGVNRQQAAEIWPINWGKAAPLPFLRPPRPEVTEANYKPGASRDVQPKKLQLILSLMAQLKCLLSWKASQNLLAFSF